MLPTRLVEAFKKEFTAQERAELKGYAEQGRVVYLTWQGYSEERGVCGCPEGLLFGTNEAFGRRERRQETFEFIREFDDACIRRFIERYGVNRDYERLLERQADVASGLVLELITAVEGK